MFKIGLLLLIFGTAAFIANLVLSRAGSKLCPNCKGEGYWKGTRGDKNFCRTCNGTGKKA